MEECPSMVPIAWQTSTAFTVDTLQAGPGSLAGSSTELKPPSKASAALITERPDISPEIPETPPAVAPENVRREEHCYGEDGNTPPRSR